ncbi:RagB/SusD family nutrient uptake outer membrane protein [Mucilaginibacter sp. ZT4R22]|uniref:RagB/SusD family nutrient uptake outer membrane protein n=1 Tax=Mucilaginibacter pankratovii TaxID=2772110 RepID=A0ABR7WK39_9SPHI|nr:RagB/SusD family nutrient uptake outer membrane protein [Mucilaginibacter pankratovii]MBD1362686.1 RagB/SusD family nutrient uptake outer membrane protein [Mucilaginibacter pankratovii]
MKFLNKLCIAFMVATAATGCKKLDLAPTDRFSDLTFWTVDANVYNALNNNYSLIYNSGIYFYNEATSDNAYSSSGDYSLIASGNFTASQGKFLNDWAYYYSTIKSCNIFLANIDQNKTLSADVIARLKAETRFIRAFEHFNLAKWYGDVPLIDKDITADEAKTIARSPKATVIKFVIDELEAAAAALPTKDQIPASENGRITKGAALALEARVLLYEGNRMADVAAICEKLMGGQAGAYSLVSNYSDLFSNPTVNKTNNESLLSLQYVPSIRTWGEFFDFAPRSVGGRVSGMSPTQELVDSYITLNGKGINDAGSGYVESNPYTNRDPRLTATVVYDKYNWVNGNGTSKTIYIKPGTDPDAGRLDEYNPASQASSPTGYYWRKYFDPIAQTSFTSGSNLHLIRYAEVLLDYAEAKQSLGQMDATVWNNTIGLLRRRAGFTDAGALDFPGTADMTNIIRRERRAELAMEGLRTDDIRRWKTAETVLNGFAHGAKFGDAGVDNGYIRAQKRQFDPAKNYLWPIPASEIGLDPNLTQNPGY